jgi:hypothetical protein
MRQLTSLDAQFLGIETSRTYGHVGSLAVYDPSTAPGGRLETADICRLVGERLHLLPVFRWRLATVPFGLDLPYWVDDPDFDLDFHIRESAVPAPGDDGKLAETVAHLRPATGPRATALGAVPHPGPAGRPRRPVDQDPPRGGGRRVRKRDPLGPSRSQPGGP